MFKLLFHSQTFQFNFCSSTQLFFSDNRGGEGTAADQTGEEQDSGCEVQEPEEGAVGKSRKGSSSFSSVTIW